MDRWYCQEYDGALLAQAFNQSSRRKKANNEGPNQEEATS
jgi:hypothetical protein